MSRLIASPGQVDVEQLKVTPKERKKEFRKKKNKYTLPVTQCEMLQEKEKRKKNVSTLCCAVFFLFAYSLFECVSLEIRSE